MESTGHHGLSCRRSGGRISRHQSANKIFHRALVSGGIPEVLEPVGVAREDGKRPYGMSLIPWEEGRPALSYGILLVVTLWLSAIETKLLLAPARLRHSRVTQNTKIFFTDIYLQFCTHLHRNYGCLGRG